MPSANRIFASYAHLDTDAVGLIVKALNDEFDRRGVPIYVWFNPNELQPGQNWEETIIGALRDCIGLLVFISQNAVRSEWVHKELMVALEKPDNLIIPIILSPVPTLPPELATRRSFYVSGILGSESAEALLRPVMAQIADLAEEYLQRESASSILPSSAAPAFAATVAAETRDVQQSDTAETAAPNSVFVVHGHDYETLREVNDYLDNLGVRSIALSQIAGAAQSLFQKFLKFSQEARFAIVLLTSDDFGASRAQYEADGVGDRALQFRARQNVILELGFFYGRLGWEKVFVVYRKSNRVFPNFELPSDLHGIVFVEHDELGLWREQLKARLNEAGFQLTT